jgi:hypothetical protein
MIMLEATIEPGLASCRMTRMAPVDRTAICMAYRQVRVTDDMARLRRVMTSRRSCVCNWDWRHRSESAGSIPMASMASA